MSEELLACFRKEKRKMEKSKRKYSHGGSSPLVCLRKMEKKKEKGKRRKEKEKILETLE
jgi:hypothetical protein